MTAALDLPATSRSCESWFDNLLRRGICNCFNASDAVQNRLDALVAAARYIDRGPHRL